MNRLSLLLVLSLAMISASCVAPKKFQALQDQKAIADDKNAQLETENASLTDRNKQQEILGGQQAGQILKLQDTVAMLQEELQGLQARYDNLMKAQDALQKGSQQEMRKLLEQIQQSQAALQAKEDELIKMENTLNERNQKLIALERALHQKDSLTNALKQKLSDALLNFEGKGLTVKIRDGKVYVSMEDKLLFASGSAEVDARGAEAIKTITGVLEKNPDINVVIEGHTDDVPYLGRGQLVDNWDLSCKRATSVVRLMLKDSDIDASRITAAGRSEYLPLNSAKTSEARQTNRRIEIILTPKLDEVLKMLEQ